MMNIRFRSKVLLVTVLPVVVTALVLASILISERLEEVSKHFDQLGSNIVNYLAPVSEYGVFSDNFTYLDSTLEHTLKNNDIVSISIIDSHGSVVLESIGENWSDIDINKTDTDEFKIFTASIQTTTVEIDDITNESDDTNATDNIVGTVQIIMSLKSADNSKINIIQEGVLITLLLAIATIFIARVFSRSVTRPIENINSGIKVIKNGELDHRIPIDFSGELAELALGINNMTSSLEIAQENARQRADDELFIEKTKAQITLEAIGEGVITTDIQGNVIYLNPAAEKLTGFDIKYAMNKPLPDVFRIKHDSNDDFIQYPIIECIEHSRKIHHESGYILNSNSGENYAIRETATPLLDQANNVVGAVLVFYDFTNIKEMSDNLAYQATHDDLTGLTNRRAFESKMHDLINDLSANETHSLCYIDLDRFKIINDTCGHLAGDDLLKIISSKINEHIRRNDLFARLGGDEFAVIFYNCDIPKAIQLAENIKSSIADIKFTWGSHTFNIGSSIGVVPIAHGDNMSDLMMTVDTACYVAKDKGRNRVHVYEKNDEDILQRQGDLQWFHTINRALDEDSFTLYSQKISPLSDKPGNEIHEILIRLNKGDEIILPGSFLPSAERYSLMAQIDKWVISNFFKQIERHDTLTSDSYFSINLSGQTLIDESFIDFLEEQLDSSIIAAEKLIFEITETVAITNFNAAINFIEVFKQRGCKFALDDFGSGMSSFQYLSKLPLDYIKIDGAFVKDIQNNLYNQSVVNSIVQIGHSLDLKIIAEFVENDEILLELDNYLVDYVQGYKIEKPHPLLANNIIDSFL